MPLRITQGEFKLLKARLAKAISSRDPDKVILECDKALVIFEERGYPDNGNIWNNARTDAIWDKKRAQLSV